MTHPRTILARAAMLALPLTLAACGDQNANETAAAPEYDADTSYLDDLAQEQGIDAEQNQPEPVATDDEPELPEDERAYADEERQWIEEEGSKSLLGRSRDSARDMRDRIQDSTEPERGIANTVRDEEYAQAAGYAWDMPEGWRMAVPSQGHFAEMYIQNPLGNASVVFSKEDQSIPQIRRQLESTITDTFGASSTRTSTKEISGYPVTIFDLEGTYIDPSGKGGGNETPFYAVHAAVIELPTTKVLIKMWGPQDTVNQAKPAFDRMLEQMYQREP